MALKVLITSKNPVKIKATQDSFTQYFDEINFFNISTEKAGLDPQPIGDKETFISSRKRVEYGRIMKPGFDYYVGIESGIVINSSNDARIILYSSVGNDEITETIRGCEIPIPVFWFKALVRQEQNELGDLISKFSGISNVKQNQGVVGILSQNIIKRYDILKQSVTMALVPFLNPSVFKSEGKYVP